MKFVEDESVCWNCHYFNRVPRADGRHCKVRFLWQKGASDWCEDFVMKKYEGERLETVLEQLLELTQKAVDIYCVEGIEE